MEFYLSDLSDGSGLDGLAYCYNFFSIPLDRDIEWACKICLEFDDVEILDI